MTDRPPEQEPLEPLAPEAAPGDTGGWAPPGGWAPGAAWVPGADAGWPPGWYPDPWTPGGQHRYWDGRGWTVHTAVPPPGPIPPPTPAPAPAPAPAAAPDEPAAPAPPAWPSAGASMPPWAGAPGPPPGPPPARSSFPWVAVLAVAIVCVLVAAVVAVVVHANTSSSSKSSSSLAPASGATTTLPPVSADPDARVLVPLGATRADVPPTYTYGLIDQGNRVRGTVTLDICNGTYTSEAQRTARYQVAVADPTGNVVLSTESVLYEDANSTALAFTELRSTAAHCPATFVPAPSGEAGVPPTKTTFGPAPDGSWPQTPTVERVAFAFSSTDPQGNTVQSTAVYLRRGRVLMGIYFNRPSGTQVAVAGRTTIPDIVELFASRIATLPSRVVTAKVAAGGSSAA